MPKDGRSTRESSRGARVIIESRRTGEQYSVTEADYHRHYEEQGFEISSSADGTPLPKPKAASAKKPAKKAATKTAPAQTPTTTTEGAEG